MEAEKGFSSDLNISHYLPPSGETSSRLFKDDVITSISVEGVKLLAQKYSQSTIYPIIKDHSSGPKDLSVLLEGVGSSIEQSFIDSLGWSWRFATEEVSDKLDYRGIKMMPGENVGQHVARALVDSPSIFFKLINSALISEVKANKTFRLFKSKLTRIAVSGIKTPDPKRVQEIERKFAKYLLAAECGSFCKFSIEYVEGNLCMFIDRAGKKNGMTFVEENNSLAWMMLRNRRFDFVLFDETTQCIWVSARGKDIEKIRSLFAELLFGEPTAYSEPVTFNLSCLLNANIEMIFANATAKARKEVRLAGAEFKFQAAFPEKSSFSTGRSKGNLFDRAQSRFMDKRLEAGTPIYSKFIVSIDEDHKLEDIIHLTGNSIKYKRLLSVEEIAAIFSTLGIVEAYKND